MCCCSMPVWPTAGPGGRWWSGSHPHRCVSFDARGHGRTTYQPEPFSRVGDALAVLDSLGSRGAVVIGNSMGGRTALDLALDHPARTTALVLIAPAISGAPQREDSPEVQAIDEQMQAADDAGDLHLLNQLEARFWLDGINGGAQGRVGGEARELFLDMNRQALAAEPPGDEDRSTNAWQRLEQLTVPTLVVVGDLDYDVSTANATAAQRIRVPRSTDCPMPPTSRFSRERGVPAGRHGVRRLHRP